MKNLLIVGGAGYIGRQIVKILENKKQFNIFVIDNLSTTKKNYLNRKINFTKLDITKKNKLDKFFKKNNFDYIIHLAAKCIVSESEKFKKNYFKTNVVGTKNLVNCCIDNKVKNFIFSSSCTVFSDNLKKVNENSKKIPKNYYGKTKLICENLIKKKFKKNNIKFIILRYFNVVGADIKNKIGEFNTKDRLFNNFSKQIINNKNIFIYGKNYKTKDGTCVRDFIHVYDLANIHIKCLNFFKNINNFEIFNCGYGRGYSILDVAKNFKKLSNKKFLIIFKNKRNGDMKEVISSNVKLKKYIKWKPKFNNLNKMILSTYTWHKYINKKSI